MKLWCRTGLAVLAVGIAVAGEPPFYYGGEGPVTLQLDSNRVLIKLVPTAPQPNGQGGLMQSVPEIVDILDEGNTVDGFVACSLSTVGNYDSLVDYLNGHVDVWLAEPYHRIGNDHAMVVGETFIVAFNVSLARSQIDSINQVYSVEIDRELEGTVNTFVLRNTPSSGMRLLQLANAYHNLAMTDFAHPDFSASISKNSVYTLYDYYHWKQPHIKKVIGEFNATSIWDFGGLSDSIVVAVIDDGIAPHDDLPSSRILQGYDFNASVHNRARDNDPTPGFA